MHDSSCTSNVSYHYLQIPVVCRPHWCPGLTTVHHRWFPRSHCSTPPLVPHPLRFHSPILCLHSGIILINWKGTALYLHWYYSTQVWCLIFLYALRTMYNFRRWPFQKCSAHNTWLTPSLTACARQLKNLGVGVLPGSYATFLQNELLSIKAHHCSHSILSSVFSFLKSGENFS